MKRRTTSDKPKQVINSDLFCNKKRKGFLMMIALHWNSESFY